MIDNLKEDIEYDVHWALDDILCYVWSDLELKVTLSPEEGVKIEILNSCEPTPGKQKTCSEPNVVSRKKKVVQGYNHSDQNLLFIAQKAPCTLIAQKKIGKSFLQNSLGISKEQNPFLEKFFGQRIDDLRGEYAKIIFYDKIYYAHFATSRTITGNASSVYIEWPRISALTTKLQEVLHDQYDFFAKNKKANSLPKELEVSYELYAINGTKAFKLVIM